ncbi:MAG TPA: molybdenum cofactor guanylyltransferase [Cyclobacteriaceae bacterium]|nr:molybdenum cofactor guanylyltransferase [Cyclobacteriaceae bacterium]
MNTKTELYGLILAGGKSERMGKAKAFINYHGIPQVDYLFKLLSTHCKKVFVSCKDSSLINKSQNPIADQFNLDTPLNGLLTAFEKYPGKTWISVPVDMPYLDDKLLQHLILHRNKIKSATCYYDSGGTTPEPLLCIWEKSIQNKMKKYFEAGGVSPREVLQNTDVQILHIPDKKYLLNINTPEELSAFKKKN